MKQEIRQNGKTVLLSEDCYSIPVIFNNLTGKNFGTNRAHQSYITNVAIVQMGFTYGKIEQFENGKLVNTGYIGENRT